LSAIRPSISRRRLSLSLAAFLVAALAIQVLPASVQAASSTFTPVADTYSQSNKPDSNFGTSVRISAQNRTTEIRRAYLRFDVQVPSGSVVTKATLRLTANGSGTSTGVDLRAVADNSWGESSLTYRNGPAVGSAVVAHAAGYADNASVSLDATSLVGGSGVVSMAITTESDSWHGFDSREASSGKPQLVVETVPVTTTTTAAPAPSPTSTFVAVADTYSQSNKPDSNFGTSIRISAQNRTTEIRRAYLRFNVGIPSGSVVSKATLRLTANGSGTSTGVDLRAVADNSWGETVLTHRNAPAVGSTVIANAGGYADNATVSLDATPLVSGPGLVSMAITTESDRWHGFDSREASSGKPVLVVETSSTTSTTAPPTTTTTAPSTTTTTSPAPPPPPPPGPAGSLHSTATQAFVDANGDEVRLRGFNVIPVWGNSPGQTWDSAKYTQIRSKGFNAVRFVLYWDDFEPSRGTWNQTNLTTLDTAVSRAKAAGLYVVLDMIHLWGSGGFNDVPAWAKTGDSVTTVQTNGAGFLKMLAGRYKNEPMVAAYDLVNEFARSPIDQNAVLRAYDSLISQVRTVDPAKIIMIEPTYGDSSIAGSLADFANLTNKTNVVWSLHDYFGGGDDDGYSSSGAQSGTYLWNGTTGYSSPNLAQLENHLLVHVNKSRAAGIPMWIGELGIGSGVANHDLWIDQQIGLFNKYGLGFAWWEYYTTGPLSATNSDFTWKPWVDRLLAGTTSTPPPPPPADTTPPAAPTGLTATAGNASVSLDWADNTEADRAGYRVYRANADGTWPSTSIATTTASSYLDTGRTNGTTYTYRVTAFDTSGNQSTPSANAFATPTGSAPPPPSGSDPVIVAAGDVACPGVCGQDDTANLIDAINPAAVLGLGDYQYDYGTLANMTKYYDPYWGRFKAKTYPANGGSHDFYGTGDYLSYFNNGGPVTLKAEGSYSYNVGSWHIVALNSYCFERSSCDETAVTNWLKADLAANPAACTLAYFHQPYWTSPSNHNRLTTTKPWIDALYNAGADVLLQAHNHFYERFAPQNPSSARDDARGLTAFVVGTGGRSFYSPSGTAANSVARNGNTYGVLKMTLRSTSADFKFMPVAGSTYTDSGTINCH
jgi:hypothetical protein